MNRRSGDEWQQWLEEYSQGHNVEAWRGIMCLLRWIQIRSENGHPIPNFLVAMEGDIYHSHLLRRMLEGKEPLETPPPESFGQPWYELVETGRAIAKEVKQWEWAPDQKISVNQGIWTIIQKISDNEYIVTYRLNPSTYKLSKQNDDSWLIVRL
jgi:hypothetical protein